MRQMVERRFPFLTGQPLFPVALLICLNAVDEFDRAAFGTLAPEIRDAFDLSNTGFGLLVGFTSVLVLLSGLPVGLLGDRVKRTRLVALAAVLWGTMSILTGLSFALWVLVIARFGSGIGRVSNEAIHTSLLTDYYPLHLQGRVFALHRAANPIGFTLGPFMAGYLAAGFGDWRPVFGFLAIPTFVAAAFVLRLREPSRGEAENFFLAAEASGESPIPFARAWRWLISIPSLKRFYVSAFFGGGAIFALFPFLALFFEEIFGVAEQGRGLIGAGNGLSQLLGTVAGGVITDRMRRRSLGSVAMVAGFAVAMIGPGLLLTGISESFAIAVLGSFIAYFSIGVWTAPTISVLAVVLPARIRSLGIGVGVMFFGVGGLIFATLAGVLADGPGLRAAISSLAPVLVLAGFIYLAASRFVNSDGQRALEALALEVELRQQRLEAKTEALLVVSGLDAAYEGAQVLFDIDFTAQRGEIVALLGTNGAGKSTLLRCISGLMAPARGAIFLDGENIAYYEPHETAREGVVQVPGGRGVFPSLTVKENLELGGWLYRRDAAYSRAALAEVLRVFPWMKERFNQVAGELSGGEQQMLALAQAFIAKPKLLLIDELSLGLAPILVEQLTGIVRAINRRGTTVVLVEQSSSLALKVADRAYFLEKGRIRFRGEAGELRKRKDLLRSVLLAGATRTTARPRVKLKTDAGPPALRVNGVSKSFGGRLALTDVSLSVTDRGLLGIIGPNGAGKTTLFDVISGFLVPDSGRVYLQEEDVTEMLPEQRSVRGLGRSFQDARLFSSLTTEEAVKVALDRHVQVRDPVAAALRLPGVRASERAAGATSAELIDRMGLGPFRNNFVSELSTGTRRVLDITCAMAHEPSVLLLDEPSAGLSQAEAEMLGPLLRELVEGLGCALVLIEHDVQLVTAVADELICMELGAVIARGTPARVTSTPEVIAAYLGSVDRVGPPSRPSRSRNPSPRKRKTPAPRKRGTR